ncbi:3D domain-containing protein [Paenibacillus sp. GCM10027626]|uniref:3D domain-containing protein n=1 Tax=Paenibacillus sp. GCM10027626 TaxID=3273411 RepID=UPI0036296D89
MTTDTMVLFLWIMMGLFRAAGCGEPLPETEQVKPPLPIVQLSEQQDAADENNGYEIFTVTAYTAGKESTGKSPGHPEYGITASGAKVKENHTAACPPSMPFGTELYIPYFDQQYVCEDRGGAIKEGKLDIYMKNLDDALEFGRRKLQVKVIEG